jgi:hypothetical protein
MQLQKVYSLTADLTTLESFLYATESTSDNCTDMITNLMIIISLEG